MAGLANEEASGGVWVGYARNTVLQDHPIIDAGIWDSPLLGASFCGGLADVGYRRQIRFGEPAAQVFGMNATDAAGPDQS